VLLYKPIALSINCKFSNSGAGIDDGAVVPRDLSTEEELSRLPARPPPPLPAAGARPEAESTAGPLDSNTQSPPPNGSRRGWGGGIFLRPLASRDSPRMRATTVRHADFRREHSRSSAESRRGPASARRIARRNPRGHPYLSPLSIIHLFILFRSRNQVRVRGIAISESDTIAAIGEALANRVIPFVESATIC